MAHPDDLSAKIRNRESWLRVAVISLFAIVAAWKIATSSIALSAIDFPTLLSTLLSLFAVALSVAFYFKATETSNTFYDNTYHFTKDISEILGRIEAGFGERLRHLDEGYSGLRDSVSRLPADESATKADLEKREAAIKDLERDKAKILAELTERAKLQENEKKSFLEMIEAKDRELRQARAESAAFRRHLVTDAAKQQASGATGPSGPAGVERTGSPLDDALRRATEYTQRSVLRRQGASGVLGEPDAIFRERFAELRDAFPVGYMDDLKALGFVSPTNQLTEAGIRWLRRITRPSDSGPM